MANIIKIKRGLSKNLSQANLQEGEMAFTTDTKKLYISNTDEPINNNTTYSLSKSGSTITLTGSDGSKTSVTDADTNTTYNAATTSANGLMTSAMVTKLNGIAEGANKYSLPTASSSTLGGVKVGTNLTISSGVLSAKDTTYSAATTSAAGLMSAADKTKLNGIATEATKNTASSTTPKANGTAAVGSETNYARGDHVHPVQTSVSGNAGTATKLATARNISISGGATGTATAFDGSANIEIPVTNLKEGYLTFGGRNITGDISAVDAAMSYLHSANRFQFANPNGITVEYSRDGGTQWTTYPTDDASKIALVSGIGTAYYIGYRNGTNVNTVKDQVRITLHAPNMGVYTALKKILINVNTLYATGCKVKVETAKRGSETTFTVLGTYNVSGWSGWNSISIQGPFGGGNTQTGNIGAIRLTFSITNITSGQNNGFNVCDIVGLGTTYWQCNSNMAKTGHIYGWDASQNVSFPRTVNASAFNGDGSAITALNANSISSGTLSADRLANSGVTAGSYGPTANVTGTNGTTINVPQITVDAKGRVTGVVNRVYTSKDSNTIYSAATTSADGLMTSAMVTKLNGIATGANAYSLPNATSSVLGGVKIGSNITISSGTISLTKDNVTAALGYTPPTTNTTYSNMTAATASAAGKAGLVPAPAAGKQASFLRGDGTWVVPTNTTYSNMTAATSSAAGKAGLVPAPAAGKQTSFLRGDGTWVVPTNTTYSAATTSAAGLMSAADKKKLDGVATSANNYSLPAATTSARGGVIVGSNITVSSGTISLTKANVTSALGYTPPTTNTTYSVATTSANGLMSSSDKTKLNGIATGAQVNNVVVSTSQPSSGDVWINPNGQMTNSLSPHIGKHIRVGQNASTSIPNKSTTTVTFNTTILNTAGSLLTLTSNGIKIGAGISKVIVNARWTCWGSFARYAYIYVNGNQHTFHMNQTGSTTQDTAFLDVVEGDIIYFKCYQESGSTQTTATSQHQTFMDVMIIG